ncbi:hypothetical protein POTOM_060960 [Populus tomentosa]|uniref:Uncharacterized protein n=1 Tax=Populus tomentosa TaxID=118781 RepID=A0A8X8BYN9_POPTO|nr:hypothetical protein POTOM_060960 [Populus tomentosa]
MLGNAHYCARRRQRPLLLSSPTRLTKDFPLSSLFRRGFPNQNQNQNKRKFDEESVKQGNSSNSDNNHHSNGKNYTLGPDNRGSGTSSVAGEMRAGKQMRICSGDDVGLANRNNNGNFGEVNKSELKKAFFHFAKVINENETNRKKYLEDASKGGFGVWLVAGYPLSVIVNFSIGYRCQSWQLSWDLGVVISVVELSLPTELQLTLVLKSNWFGAVKREKVFKDFPDMHALIMHTYSSDNADVRVDHLGLHKALCILMRWNYSMPPDNSKAYQFLPADEQGQTRMI